MSGLLRRLRRDRHASHDPAAAPAGTASERATAPGAHAYTEGRAHEESTAVLEPVETTREDLDTLVGAAPTSRRRGRLRRRLRHLRRVREVLMRDLGGFVFEVHRSGREGGGDSVVEAKLRRLATVDAELRELEAALDDRRPLVMREAGIGGACPRCGELFSSEARFCWACGTPVAPGAGHVPELPPAHAATSIDAGEQATTELPDASPAVHPDAGEPPVAESPPAAEPPAAEEPPAPERAPADRPGEERS